MLTKRLGILLLAQLFGACVVHSKASTGADDPPVVTKTFYDTNYHDDGLNHLRGPTAASSSNTISVISPQSAASTTSQAYAKPGSSSIMAIVDHFYGPNGEEQVKYSNPSQMDKSELEQILANIGGGGSGTRLTYDSPPQHSTSSIAYSPYSHSSGKGSSMPDKFVKAPLSSLYKSSSSPSYTSAAPSTPGAGYSLSSLYKSSSDSSYAKPSTSYRPAFSTIYKDPQYTSYSSKPTHYTKGSPEYSMSTYHKEPVLLHSPKEPSYYKPSPYYSTDSHPKSINDAILGDSYSKGYAPSKGFTNVIENDETYPYASSPSYRAGPTVMSHPPSHHDYSGTLGGTSEYLLSGQKIYSPGLKAGLHSLPVKYSGPEYMSSPPSHETYSSGYAGGYPVEDSGSLYSYGSSKGNMKRPPPTMYTSSPSTSTGGHSLSSLYDPSAFEELYNSPKAKPVYSSQGMTMVKPGYGPPPPPGAYMLSYGPPVEYNMPPKGIPYTTSSSPYASPPHGLPSPRYKGPYRTVNSGPMGYASHIGYGYGKPHNHHGNLLASSSNILYDMLHWYKTRGGGWAKRPPMLKMTPYYNYKYSTLSHSTNQMRPMYENGASEKFYHYVRPNPYGPFGRFPFHF